MNKAQEYFILLVLCGFTFFAHLDEFAPDLMEARNFITAREMIVDGNWLSPTMNGEPRLEKPPLPTWMTALSAELFGGLDSPFAMRIPAAFSGILLVFFFYGFCRDWSVKKNFPLFAAGVLATSMMIVQQARTNSWDIHAHAFMMGGIWMLYRGWTKGTWQNYGLSALLMGLGMLSKGPIPLYALWLPFMFAYGFGYKNGLLKKTWKPTLVALIGALTIGFGWNAYIYIELPEVMEYVVNKETNSWGARHVRPFYFYLHFPVFTGIWCVFGIAALFYKYAKPTIDKVGNYRFALIWVLVSVFLLSVVPTKKERYLLPAMIPMALLAASLAYGIIESYRGNSAKKWDKIVLGIFAWIVGVAGIAGPPIAFALKDQYAFNALFAITVTILLALGVRSILLYRKSEARKVMVNAMAMVALICAGLTPQLSELYYQHPDFRSISEIRTIPEMEGLPVLTTMDDPNMKLVWAAGQKLEYIDFDTAGWSEKLPAVIISATPAEQWIPKEITEEVQVEDFGIFDYFRKDSPYKASVSIIRNEE